MNHRILLSAFLMTGMIACKTDELILPVPKPDLVIETITCQRLPNCQNDGYGGIICSAEPRFAFTLKIRNIGDAPLDQFFYISKTRSMTDLDSNYCPHTAIANYPPANLPPNGEISVSFDDLVADSTAAVLFIINTNDLYSKGNHHLPVIDERRYDNNSYRLNMQW